MVNEQINSSQDFEENQNEISPEMEQPQDDFEMDPALAAALEELAPSERDDSESEESSDEASPSDGQSDDPSSAAAARQRPTAGHKKSLSERINAFKRLASEADERAYTAEMERDSLRRQLAQQEQQFQYQLEQMARQYEENGMKLMELERNIYGNAAPAAQNQWNANANNPYQGQQQQHSQWQQQQTPNNPYSQQRMQSAVPDAEKPLTRRDIEALEVERRNQEYVRSIKTQWDEKAASAKSERQRAAIEDAFKKASRDVEKNPAIFAVLSACAKQANGAEILRALQAGTGENDYRTLRGDQLMAKALDYGQQIVRARAQPTKSVSAPTPKGSVPKGKPSSAKMSYKEYLESKTATTPAPRK